MRIMPLWLTNVFILTILVGAISHFTLRESFPGLVFNISQWLLFMEPDINKVSGTRYINSGVHWSLAYEGLFYCSLAIIGSIFFRIKTTLPTIVLTVIFCSIFIIIIDKYYAIRKWERMAPFLAGSFAAFIARNEKIRKISSSHWLTPVLAALLYNVLFNYPNAFQLIPFLSIAIVFTAIACGNNFFGILTYKPTMLLGQISYSIYLLHGFILFSTFYFFIGFNLSEKLSVLNHWAIICVCTIAVIIVSAISYKYLEKPGIEISDKITQKTKLLFGKRNLKSTGQTLHQ
jgi:peptidoglycan/LPS O-acetylase OafA/YrhL